MTDKLDPATAWHELARFAELADVELDERAHPDWKPDEEGEEELPENGESDISDYRDLLRAFQSGHMDLDEQGVLTVHWKKPPSEKKPDFVLNPNDWPYSRALSAMHKVPEPPAVSKAARKRTPASSGDDKIGRLDRMLETLAGEPLGTLKQLNRRRDRDLANALTNFIVSE